MATATANNSSSCTPYQQGFIVGLMRRLELSTLSFTLMHRRCFSAAGLGEPPVDKPVHPFLATLTDVQARRLIEALKTDLGDEDDDDE